MVICTQITWESCYNVGSNSRDGGQGPGFCISNQSHDAAAGPQTTLEDLDQNICWLEKEDGTETWEKFSWAHVESSVQVNIEARTFHG